jgi:hypothetical protein
MLPALRRRLVAWELKLPRTDPRAFVIATVEGGAVQERNLRRALDDAKTAAKLEWRRRAPLLALAASLVRLDARDRPRSTRDDARPADRAHRRGIHAPVYARDARDDAGIVEDVLTRAVGAGVGC